jgi:hypothetical protein
MSKETKNIIIMTHGRSGSNLLCRLLSQYDCINANTETAGLDCFPQKINLSITDINLRKKIQKYYPYKSFNEFVELMRILCDKKFMSFKIFSNQAKEASWKFEDQKHSSFIILERNMLDNYLSLLTVDGTKNWVGFDTTNTKIKFCSHEFERHCNDLNNNLQAIDKTIENSPHLKSKVIKVDYKEFMLETEQDKFMEKIFNFFKIKHTIKIKPKVNFANKKQNKNKNFNFVINKEEMLKFMKSNEVLKKILNESVYSNLPI